MTDYAILARMVRLAANAKRPIGQSDVDLIATALETLLEERSEWQAWAADGFAVNEEKARLTAENARLRDKAENVVIAHGMGWDMDGVIEALRDVLPAKP